MDADLQLYTDTLKRHTRFLAKITELIAGAKKRPLTEENYKKVLAGLEEIIKEDGKKFEPRRKQPSWRWTGL